jgi:hypothetical protein
MLKCVYKFTRVTIKSFRVRFLVVLLTSGMILTSCAGLDLPKPDPVKEEPKRETIFGDGGIDLFGNDSAGGGRPSGGPSIGVNVFLWRATLDTLSLWPISSADPFGGVVLTEWYSTPEVPKERFKMNVYILDRALRADGVRVSVFRQSRDANNNWRSLPVQPGTSTKIEDAILTRARQFRGSIRK